MYILLHMHKLFPFKISTLKQNKNNTLLETEMLLSFLLISYTQKWQQKSAAFISLAQKSVQRNYLTLCML